MIGASAQVDLQKTKSGAASPNIHFVHTPNPFMVRVICIINIMILFWISSKAVKATLIHVH